MRLNEKVLAFLLLFFMMVISVVLIAGPSVYLAAYEKLDERETLSNIQNAVHALNTSRTNELRILADWAIWDATYDYLRSPEHPPAYIEHNLLPETFRQLDIELFAISDPDGRVVWGSTYDRARNTLQPLPAEMSDAVAAINAEMAGSRAGDSASGIVIIGDRPLVIATAAVVHTDGTGPVAGRITMGTPIDSVLISQIAAVSSSSVAILPAGDPRIPGAVRSRLTEIPPLEPVARIADETSIEGYVLLNNLFGAPALVIATREERDFLQQGLSSLTTGIFVFLGFAALLGSLTLIMVDRSILRRLGILRDAADEIRKSGTLAGEVDVGGNDELSDVAVAFNQMIRTIGENQRELAGNQEYLDRIFTSVRAGIMVIDAETRAIIDINPAGAAMLREAKEEIIGRPCQSYFREVRSGSSSAARPDGTVDDPERILLRTDGTNVPVISNATRLNIRGRDCLLETFIDNTERKRIEQALRESEEKFRSLVETSPDILWEIDTDGTVRYISPMVSDLLGYTPEEIVGRPLNDLVPEKEQPETIKRMAWAFSSESPLPSIEIPARHRNGNELVLEIRPTRLIGPDGKVAGLRGVAVDITSRRRAEAALRESEEKFRNLAENTADILFTLDRTGQITYVSPQVSQYGYAPEELIEKPFLTVIHPEDSDSISSTFSTVMTTGVQIVSAFRIIDRQGSIFWVEERSNVLFDDQGRARGLQGVIRDITDRKKAEDAICLANRKLNLLNDITRHDIVNTLTGLLGTVEMARDPAMSDERDLLLSDVHTLGLNIQKQIEFTREYQAVGIKEPVWQNVARIIQRAANLCEESGVTIVNDITPFEVFADPLLEKVFYNLIQNALSYGKNVHTIRFTERISDRGFAIVCEDDGVGIPAEMKEKSFGRGIGQNTGMGLFLSREILAITGITIRENGIPGKGARFEMVIPKGGYRFP